MVGRTEYFVRASCTRFSPISRMPASRYGRTVANGTVLVTTTSVIAAGLRPTRWAALPIRSRILLRFSGAVSTSGVLYPLREYTMYNFPNNAIDREPFHPGIPLPALGQNTRLASP